MIKKMIILLLLAAIGYVGYLVWGNLTPKEKAVVTKKASSVVDNAKKLAGKAADKLTGVAKDEIKKIDKEENKKKPEEGKAGNTEISGKTDKKPEAEKPEVESP